MTHLIALEQAHSAYTHHQPDRQARYDNAVKLGEWGLFSNAQISHFTGLDPHVVGRLTGKTDRTGGRLPAAALPYLIRYIQGVNRSEVDRNLIREAFRAGASTRMIAKFAGITQTRVVNCLRVGE